MQIKQEPQEKRLQNRSLCHYAIKTESIESEQITTTHTPK